ncbi:MAG: FAD-dependent oxidoreductase [Candidatus Saccharibacteria bacterium]|nr:FAD-dependent oxidoreductase [Candidatus Saccharibacteria bacterium]
MNNRKTVTIIGGGLAGLTAAYRLSKNEDYQVTLLEGDDRVGGRVKTVFVANQPVDIGGFMVFPWYKHFRALLKELDLEDRLKNFANYNEYYQLESGGGYIKDSDVPIWQVLPWKLMPHLIIPFLTNKLDFYEPDLEFLNGESVKQAFDEITGNQSESEKLAAQVATSYTYAELDEIPIGLYLGFGYKLLAHHLFDKCQYIEGGTEKLTNSLVRSIKENGGIIRTGQKVISAKPGVVKTESDEYISNFVILANGLHDPLVSQTLGGKQSTNNAWYTNHYAAVLKLDRNAQFNGETNWMVTYNRMSEDKSPSIASIGNLGGITGEKGNKIVFLYLRIHHEDKTKYSDKDIKGLIINNINKHLAEVKIEEFLELHHWQYTMPVVSTKLISDIRENQGVNNIYYAGDFMGSPCMETAVYTGHKVAKLIESNN